MMWPFRTGRTRERDDPADGASRRRSERIETAVLACDLGTIVDVSRHGACVRMAQRPRLGPGAQVYLELSSPVDAIGVTARVVRAKRVSGGRYDVALDFGDLNQATGESIENLARTGSAKGGTCPGAQRVQQLVASLKQPDYYAALGLKPEASAEDVQRAFRALARRYHPDVCREPGAQQKFCEINEAYAVLSDAERRGVYDEALRLRRAA